MKILSVFGTRPEAIKMAPVIRELQKYPGRIRSIVCVTAQHRQMLDQVLDFFDIAVDYDLNVMEDNQSPTQVASAVLDCLDPILREEQPDWVLVQGDTTTTLVAALAAFYAGVKIGHVEAGLRTNDKWQPFPEEINRRAVSVIADLHFAPTGCAQQNLLAENIPFECIVVTGNTVIDALHWVSKLSYNHDGSPLMGIPWYNRIILVTAHRRESFGEPLERMCRALLEIAARDDVHIVYPVHLNPNVREPVYRLLDGIPNITLLPPLDYQSFTYLMSRSYLILTDSGGIQEEAASLGKPVLVMRETTERPEAVEAGISRVVGTDHKRIVAEVARVLGNFVAYESMAQATNLYGDGRASRYIVAALLAD